MVEIEGQLQNNDAVVLAETADLQNATLETLRRVELRAAEIKQVGVATLEELNVQGQQIGRIQQEQTNLKDRLEKADRLLNRVGFWLFHWRSTCTFRQETLAKAQIDRKTLKSSNFLLNEAFRTSDAANGKRRSRSENASKVIAEPAYNTDDLQATKFMSLTQKDAEIDSHLAAIGSQLDSILLLSKTIGNETQAHNEAMGSCQEQMIQLEVQQNVVTYRVNRLLKK